MINENICQNKLKFAILALFIKLAKTDFCKHLEQAEEDCTKLIDTENQEFFKWCESTLN